MQLPIRPLSSCASCRILDTNAELAGPDRVKDAGKDKVAAINLKDYSLLSTCALQAFINTARKVYEKIDQGVFDVSNEVSKPSRGFFGCCALWHDGSWASFTYLSWAANALPRENMTWAALYAVAQGLNALASKIAMLCCSIARVMLHYRTGLACFLASLVLAPCSWHWVWCQPL